MASKMDSAACDNITLRWIANGRGKPAVIAQRGEEVLHTERIDLLDSKARERLAARLHQMLGTPPARLQETLLRFGVEWIAQQQADQAMVESTDEPAEESDPFVIGQRELEATEPDVLAEAERMAHNPELLREVYDDLVTLGIVGEAELALTIWLVGVSRVLPEPMAAVVTGPTSTGKSYVGKTVARLFPGESKLVITDASPQSWYYLPPGALRHRFVLVGERNQSETPEAIDARRAWRELLSEGRLVKSVPVKMDGQLKTQLIEQEGPIAFVESTTRTELFDEDASRLLFLSADESRQQTRRVVHATLRRALSAHDGQVRQVIWKHHTFQRILGQPRVVIPYAERLASKFPDVLPQCRRLCGQVVAMIRASAVAHRYQRETVDGDVVVAAPEDYAIAYRLLGRPAAIAAGEAVPPAVASLYAKLSESVGEMEFTAQQAAEIGGVTRQWANNALWTLTRCGSARQVREGKGPNPALWVLTGKPPEAVNPLPPIEEVFK